MSAAASSVYSLGMVMLTPVSDLEQKRLDGLIAYEVLMVGQALHHQRVDSDVVPKLGLHRMLIDCLLAVLASTDLQRARWLCNAQSWGWASPILVPPPLILDWIQHRKTGVLQVGR